MTSGRHIDVAPSGRPAGRVWFIATLEIIGAIVVARLILSTSSQPSTAHHEHMTGMRHGLISQPHWYTYHFGILLLVVLALGVWLVTRSAIPALVVVGGIVMLVASEPARAMAAQSHLLAMVALELTLVAVPIFLWSAWPRFRARHHQHTQRSRAWDFAAIGTAAMYAALLIAIHVPAIHHRVTGTGATPVWLVVAVLVIGLLYWPTILAPCSGTSVRVRRAALIGAQEVAAFVGLLSLFGAWGSMASTTPLGLSMAWDQRLGGIFMLTTCAAVTLPIERRLRARAE
jgi:hypothetical protein